MHRGVGGERSSELPGLWLLDFYRINEDELLLRVGEGLHPEVLYKTAPHSASCFLGPGPRALLAVPLANAPSSLRALSGKLHGSTKARTRGKLPFTVHLRALQ